MKKMLSLLALSVLFIGCAGGQQIHLNHAVFPQMGINAVWYMEKSNKEDVKILPLGELFVREDDEVRAVINIDNPYKKIFQLLIKKKGGVVFQKSSSEKKLTTTFNFPKNQKEGGGKKYQIFIEQNDCYPIWLGYVVLTKIETETPQDF